MFAWWLWPGLPIQCGTSGESSHPCLFPDFNRKTQFFTTEYYVGWGFAVNSFYYILICSLYTHFGEIFYHKWMLNFIRCFTVCNEWSCGFHLSFCWWSASHWLICVCWTVLVIGTSSPKEKQWQRMLKLLHNCTHLTR